MFPHDLEVLHPDIRSHLSWGIWSLKQVMNDKTLLLLIYYVLLFSKY